MIEAMKQALVALEHSHANEPIWKTPHKEAIISLRQAIEQAEKQEPVAYIDHRIHGWPDCIVQTAEPPHTSPLYTTPQPQREWVGLTDKEAMQICEDCGCMSEDWLVLLDAIEAKLKERNGGNT